MYVTRLKGSVKMRSIFLCKFYSFKKKKIFFEYIPGSRRRVSPTVTIPKIRDSEEDPNEQLLLLFKQLLLIVLATNDDSDVNDGLLINLLLLLLLALDPVLLLSVLAKVVILGVRFW